MTPDQYDHIQHVFLSLRDVSEADRKARLDREDNDVRREVLSLLAADQTCDGFLEHAGMAAERQPTIDHDLVSTPPDQVGDYRLLQQIGEGGQGTVYMAEQRRPITRKVAIKLIKPGMDSKQVLARFQAERQALALMDHPSIARVLDAGSTTSGAPYFVMELVQGIAIDEFCEANHLDLEQRLRLFLQVCQAVHHAHQKGIIHRDLKPSNVLVAMGEGEPIAKVIDFGIAKALQSKLTGDTLFTGYGQMIGTLQYMSPEQAEMSAVDIDTRADVYSLGVMLYQLLTGTTPLSREQLLRSGLIDVPRVIRDTEPATPSARVTSRHLKGNPQRGSDGSRSEERPRGLEKLQRGDLDWIVMKALAKDRRQRYESALDLVRDLERFLAGSPVHAHPPSIFYHLSKFVRRHRRMVAMTSIALAGMVLGVLGLVAGLQQAQQAYEQADQDRHTAVQAKRQLAESMYSELLRSASFAARQHDAPRARRLLEACPPDLRGWEWKFAAGTVKDHPYRVLRPAGGSLVSDIDVRSSALQVASITDNGALEVRDLTGGHLEKQILGPELGANVVRYDGTGRRLIVGTARGELHTFDTANWQPSVSRSLHLGAIYDLDIADQPGWAAVCTGGGWVEVVELDTLASVARWELPSRVAGVAFATDARELVAAGFDGNAYFLAVGDAEYRREFVSEAGLGSLTRTNSGEFVVVSAGKVIVLNAESANLDTTLAVRSEASVSAVTLAGGQVYVGTGDGQLIGWSAGEGQRLVARFGHAVTGLSFTVDGGQLVVALADGRLLVVETSVQGGDKGFVGRDVNNILPLMKHKLWLCCDDRGWLRAYDFRSHEQRKELRVSRASIWSWDCDVDEKILVAISDDQQLRCWELPGLELRFEREVAWGVRDVCVAADGTWIAAAPPADSHPGQREGTIAIWDALSGEVRSLMEGHDNWVLKMAATSDGTTLVSTCENRTTRIWNLKNGQQTAIAAPAEKAPAEHLVLDPEETSLLLGHRDGWITAWNLRDGSPINSWGAFGDAISGLHITPDDRVLVTSRSSNLLRVFNAQESRLLAEFDLAVGYTRGFQLGSDVTHLGFVGQDRRLLPMKLK